MQRPTATAAREARVFKPRLENLEERIVHAVSVVAGIVNITGSMQSDVVEIVENHETNTVQVKDNGVLHTFNSNQIDGFRANMMGGNNSFSYRVEGTEVDHEREFTILGSTGFDYVTLDFRGDYSKASITADQDIYISTGALSDQVGMYLPEIDDAEVRTRAYLGDGNDGFSLVQTGDMINNGDYFGYIYGGDGNDNLYHSANHDVDLDADSDLRVYMNGGDGDDSMLFYYDGELDGDLNIDLYGRAGDDYIRTSTMVDAGSTGRVFIDEFGGDGYDRLFAGIRNYGSAQININRIWA